MMNALFVQVTRQSLIVKYKYENTMINQDIK